MPLNEELIKLTRIEERTPTGINIIYPETVAEQVIESDEHQFVTKDEKEQWNNLTLSGLKYQGEYNPSTIYAKNDVVTFSDKFYIAKGPVTNIEPSDTEDNDNWINLNKEAVEALRAQGVYVENVSSGTFTLSLIDAAADGDYQHLTKEQSINLIYNVGTKTLKSENFEGHLIGKADEASRADVATEAEQYTKYARNEDGSLVNGVYTRTGSEYIDTAISGIRKTLEGITNGEGDVTLKNPLKVYKDGILDVTYDGSGAVDLRIQQKYTPTDIIDLLENGKIKETWLPDFILGQLSYKGTWDPSIAGTVVPNAGDYYIATNNGNYYPDGTTLPTGSQQFETGDWAVYNGDSWDKIDNTDAVRTVNNQIGDVKIYKGSWVAGAQYYHGDIVKHEGVLYIANTDNNDATFTASKWEVFGRLYTASDGIKLDGTVFKHDVAILENTESNITLTPENKSFSIHEVTKDAYGHVTKINNKVVTLGDDFVDTVRPIQVNGVELLGKNDKTALNVANGNKINVVGADGKITINHVESTATNKNFDVTQTDQELHAGETFSVPSFTIDDYGHVVSGQKISFKIADNFIKHNHFNVVKDDTDGSTLIKAYEGINNAAALNAIGGSKFYVGNAAPTSADVMKLNAHFHATALYQGANQVVDSAFKILSGYKYSATSARENIISGEFDPVNKTITLGESGVIKDATQDYAVYSAVAVNRQGIAVAGGQIIEFGQEVNADPSDSLAVGGLFFRLMSQTEA